MSNKHVLSQKPRKVALTKTPVKNNCELHEASAQFPLKTDEGKPTIAGVHRHLWKNLRNMRKLKISTADQYESIMDKVILPAFEQDVAFADITEDDVLDAWDRIITQTEISLDKKRKAATIIRTFFDLAQKEGLTQVSLWGLPITEDQKCLARHGKSAAPADGKGEEEEGAQLAKEVLLPKSISLETEFRMVRIMINNLGNYGELIAGLIMFCTGVRTSEACSFLFKDLQELCEGYWTLSQLDVSRHESRETRAGSKTDNGNRLLVVYSFLARLILERKEQLQRLYPGESIDDFPIACRGRDHRTPCTQSELNRILKRVYEESGVEEDVMAHAYSMVRSEDADVQDEFECWATAYLGRRHFATVARYCGLTAEEICVLMGHAILDRNVKRYDYANPDKFKEISDKLRRRPLAQVFDNQAEYHQYTFSGEVLQIKDDGAIELYFPEECDIHISVKGLSYEEITISDIGIQQEALPFFHDIDTSNPLSTRQFLWKRGQRVWEKIRQEDPVFLVAPVTEADFSNWEELKENLPREKEEKNLLHSGNQSSGPEENTKNPTMLNGRYAISNATLYLIGEAGFVGTINEEQRIQTTSGKGRYIKLENAAKLQQAVEYSNQSDALIVSPNGFVFKVRAKRGLANADFYNEKNPAYQALLAGGVLLQGTAMKNAKGTVVCLTDSGRIRRISMKALQRFPDTGRRLVTMEQGERIVSACLCQEQSDVLIVTERGYALRIGPRSLRPITTPGANLYPGISLERGDRAVACIAYEECREYLVIKRSGQVIRTDKEFRIQAHGRNTHGKKLVKVVEGDGVLSTITPGDALFLLSEQHEFCIDTTKIPSVVNAAFGVKVMKLKAGENVVAAVAMRLNA